MDLRSPMTSVEFPSSSTLYFLPFLLLGLLQLCVLLSLFPISTCSKILLFPIGMTHHEFSIMKVYFVFVVEDLLVVHTLVFASASHLLSSHCSNQLYMTTNNFESMIMCSIMVTEIPILVYDIVCKRWCLRCGHSLLQC